MGKARAKQWVGRIRCFLLPWRLCYFRCLIMAFRPLTARAPAVLLREAKPLKAIFGHAQRLGHLQRLLESQLQPAATIQATADGISDPNLRAALERLAAHARPKA